MRIAIVRGQTFCRLRSHINTPTQSLKYHLNLHLQASQLKPNENRTFCYTQQLILLQMVAQKCVLIGGKQRETHTESGASAARANEIPKPVQKCKREDKIKPLLVRECWCLKQRDARTRRIAHQKAQAQASRTGSHAIAPSRREKGDLKWNDRFVCSSQSKEKAPLYSLFKSKSNCCSPIWTGLHLQVAREKRSIGESSIVIGNVWIFLITVHYGVLAVRHRPEVQLLCCVVLWKWDRQHSALFHFSILHRRNPFRFRWSLCCASCTARPRGAGQCGRAQKLEPGMCLLLLLAPTPTPRVADGDIESTREMMISH